jgi:hypothetical protein
LDTTEAEKSQKKSLNHKSCKKLDESSYAEAEKVPNSQNAIKSIKKPPERQHTLHYKKL